MAWWEWPVRIGGWAAAPWTGGMSIPASEGAIAIGNRAGGGGSGNSGGTNKSSKNATEAPYLDLLRGQSEQAGAEGSDMLGMGSEAIQPALRYLTALAGGDPAALMDATRQERGRVIDQYDTARRAISNFGPRGGGTTSALAESRFSQAESLADITSTARRDAVANLGQLAPMLASLGLTAEQMQSQDLNSIIDAIMTREGLNVQKRGQNMEAWTGIGTAAGQIFMDWWLNRNKGKSTGGTT